MDALELALDASILQEYADNALLIESLVKETIRLTNYDLDSFFNGCQPNTTKEYNHLSPSPLIRYFRNQIYTQILMCIPRDVFFNNIELKLKNIRRCDVLVELLLDYH